MTKILPKSLMTNQIIKVSQGFTGLINYQTSLIYNLITLIIIMKIKIRREPDFQTKQYIILEFTGQFQANQGQSKSMINLGLLVKVDPLAPKDKPTYVLQMGVMDLSGFQVQNLDQTFLHVQTSEQSSQEQKILIVKGIVTKKIIFNKRPYANLDRASEHKNVAQKYNIFRKI